MPPISIFSNNGPDKATILNSNCCPQGAQPNLEFSFDCNNKTIKIKCIE